MSYTKTNWTNNSTPAINASNLTKIENQLTALTSVTDTNLKSTLLNMFYPVGSIYTSTTINSSTASVSGKAGCPIADIGGTWQRITGQFLLAATDNGSSNASQAAGNTGGQATHYHKTAIGFDGGNLYGYLEGGVPKYGSDVLHNITMTQTALTSGTSSARLAYTDTASSLPPYLSVYMWKRTS